MLKINFRKNHLANPEMGFYVCAQLRQIISEREKRTTIKGIEPARAGARV